MQKAFVNASKNIRPKPALTQARAFASGTTFERFNFEDPFKLNSQLTDEELAISEAARQFSQEKLMPRVREAYNKETFDIEIMKEMGQ
jgi:glutaryl-CoA dehydrogenase